MGDRILGVVGGLGPESTIDYYRRLIDGYHARVGPALHPRMLINSVDGAMIPSLVAGDLEPVRAGVAEAVERLAVGGAGLAIVGSVAAHAVYDAVAPGAPIPMLSIVEATVRATIAAGVRRPALFGTRMSTEGAWFARPFEAAGLELVRPVQAERDWMHDAYMGQLVLGIFSDDTRARLLDILAGLMRSEGADGLILGGTELSLILPEPAYLGIPVLNAAAIHVSEALDWLVGGDERGGPSRSV
jgi:aspartate racemase